MSIFKISTDNRSMYPSMYLVMYVEKNVFYFAIFDTFGIGIYIFFVDVALCSGDALSNIFCLVHISRNVSLKGTTSPKEPKIC